MRKLISTAMFTVSIACATAPAYAGVDRFTSISPEGAGISTIAVDPTARSTIYAGSPHAGVFKSLDGGESWKSVFDLEKLRLLNATTERIVTRLVIDPVHSSTVYATISAYHPGAHVTSGEIVKTKDGGLTWMVLSGWQAGALLDLVIDPSKPETLYALTTQSRLMQSDDGGISWSSRIPALDWAIYGEPISLAIDRSLPSRLYLGSKWGLFVSNERGGVWQRLLQGRDFSSITADPADSATLYVTTGNGLIRSRDGGKTWTTLLAGGVQQFVLDSLSSAAYAVMNAPGSDGGFGILATTDRGDTWSALPRGFLAAPLLAVEPGSTRVLYAASQGDLFKSETGGESWRPINQGLPGPYVYDIAADTSGSTTLFAATTRGVIKSGDGGQQWREVIPRFPWAQLSIDPRNTSTVFAYSDASTRRSTDGGENWTIINPGHAVKGIEVDPSDRANVYAVLWNGLSRSRDGGSTWSAVGTGQLPTAYYGFDGGAIAIDPVTPTKIYAAGSAGIVKSEDAGTTWKTVFKEGEFIQKLLVNPATPSTVYALAYDKLYRSYNEGKDWEVAYIEAQSGVFFRDLALDPSKPSRLYLATNNGLLKSENDGSPWTDFNEGLPAASVNAVSIDLYGNVYAGTTHGLFVASPRHESVRAPLVSLRTLSGSYVSANDCGGSFVSANATVAGPCEMFSIYDLNGGLLHDGDRIHLQAADGNFVAAEDGGRLDRAEVPVNANRRLPSAWETFVIRSQGGGAIHPGDRIALQSIKGTYIAAESGGAANCACDSRLNANRFEAREWETFVIELR